MRQIFSALKRAFRNSILTVALVSLLSFSGLLIFSVQSSLAAAPTPTHRPPSFGMLTQSASPIFCLLRLIKAHQSRVSHLLLRQARF